MTTKLTPLFRWTGGKNKMKQKYGADFWPEKPFTRFIDAFYGGGSISHWVYENYPQTEFVINDQNSELIQLYEVIRDHPDDFIAECLRLETDYLNIVDSDKEQQYLRRHDYYTNIKMSYVNWDTNQLSRISESAHLYFLMKTCFNGWWKVYSYSRGRYSTPPGTLLETRPFIDSQLIKQHSQFFRNQCTILTGDFEIVKPWVNDSTYLYFDPPYRDSTTEYTEAGFTDLEQIRLCEFFNWAHEQGARVGLSNKEIGDGFFEKHLAGHQILLYDVKYTAGRGTTMNQVKENFIRNFSSKPTHFQSLFETV